MATVKLTLDTRSTKKDGTHSIKLYVSHRGEDFFISTNISVKKDDWKVYVIYNDICERDLPKMFIVLFTVQLGFFTFDVLKDACAWQYYLGRELVPVDDVCLKLLK